MTRNFLAEATSPYLLQHKDNPVHWRPWSTDAFTIARSENKPVLLSIGYAACHWCHVMAHESFEEPAIAGLMNELFVNIKVDREERPDVDAIYQSALAMMGEHGGWPLTMFLTPDGDPFWGGTYFPSEPRYGRPAFPDILKTLAEVYRSRGDKVAENARALRDGLARLSKPDGGGLLDFDKLDEIASQINGLIDHIHGGTQGAPKFPQPALFQFLWRAYLRSGTGQYRASVVTTLDHICQGGIYDHLGGGFARYSTDEVWLAPHFEKMLYDNACLIELLTAVWLDTRSSLYEARIRETVDWALREMRAAGTASGAFVSAFDADSEGEEGRFYVWTEAEIDRVLGAKSKRFKQAYDVSSGGNWEGKCILNRSRAPELGGDEAEADLAVLRARLFEERAKRVPPARDNKVLADWNGLMIAALARAAAVFDEDGWLDEAIAAFDFVVERLSDEERLHHAWCEGRADHPAVLDDYANMARAAIALFEISGEAEYLARAEAWVEVVDRHYWDEDGGGYFLVADDTDDVIARPKTAQDNATPPGNGTMGEVLTRLHYITGKAAYRSRAEALFRALTPVETMQSANHLTLLCGYELLESALQVVVVGDGSEKETEALRRVVFQSRPANRVVTLIDAEDRLPQGHPAHGKGLVDGRPAAYICRGAVCGLPITEAAELRSRLEAP